MADLANKEKHMRPILNASYPVHIPGVRPLIPMEVKFAAPVVAKPPVAEVEAEPVAEVEVAPVEADEDLLPGVFTDEPSTPAPPAWSARMTKPELIAVAEGLSVEVAGMTKTEILSALDATL